MRMARFLSQKNYASEWEAMSIAGISINSTIYCLPYRSKRLLSYGQLETIGR